METPPASTQQIRYQNFMPFRNQEPNQRGEIYNKFNFKLLSQLSPSNDREIVQKIMIDLKKKIKYLEETNWMFESNIPAHLLPYN